jgi:hypothetical protein
MHLLFILVPIVDIMSVITDTDICTAKDLILKIDRHPESDLDVMRAQTSAIWRILKLVRMDHPLPSASRHDRHRDHRRETKD